MTVEWTKKRKLESLERNVISSSRVFSPFRVVGNVTNAVPFAVGTLGTTFYIVTSVGKTFQIYDANNLHLLFVSERETERPIVALATHFHYVFAAYGNKVGVYKRGICQSVLELEDNVGIRSICVFGDFMCITADNNTVYFYRKNSSKDKYPTEYYTKFTVGKLLGGDIVSVVHLATYLNKVVIVTKSNLLLYNIRTGKLIFSSDEFPDEITVAEPAPALDTLALGTSSGEIILFNVKKGRKIRTIRMPQLRITSLSFRTDGSPHLCLAFSNGDMVFYDLDRRSRIHVLKNIHSASHNGVIRASFLNGQPIVVTSGGDNKLKEYVFDPSLSQANDEVVVQPPRFLRSRGGHSQPPSSIAFADAESHFILSASRDRSLWGFSLRKDAQSQEFSQRLHKKKDGSRIGGSTIKEKLPEIVALAIENARVGEWENIITAHRGEVVARTWDMRRKRVGRWTLDTTDGGYVKSVALSQCGNFGFVGSSNGSIAVYNMQSGILRKKYKFHRKAVTGIGLDSMNRKMVSCGLDGLVGFYDFNQSTLLGKLQLDAPITAMVYNRPSDLFALALDDLSIIVIDAVTQRVVRQLWGHTNRITAFDFSPDGRWVVSASLDGTIRTWDLPTGGCVDGIRVESVATDLKFSPKGDFVATTHVAGNGICIWTNKAQFKPISTRTVDEEEFSLAALPNASITGGGSLLEGAFEGTDEGGAEEFSSYQTVEQISDDLITLSLGPRNKMNTLLALDVIRQRSKPKEQPKKSKDVPFFLQLAGEVVGDEASTREGLISESREELRRKNETERNEDLLGEQVANSKPTGLVGFESKFTKLLREGGEVSNFTQFLQTLVDLSPASADLEIKSLATAPPYNEIVWFISALTQGLSSNKNFDLYEAFMSLLMKAHGDVIHANNNDHELKKALNTWTAVHTRDERLVNLVNFCAGVVNFISST
ncbi:probable U3 small nucleolar RNA-associated protein 21 [Zygosaccharomyces bailii ISA1307]|nr:probable U3 small nucleolar RNA-associated protein 21 [Zygosaccharomyces bailii ISA1307]